ncbi:MAG: biotin-dependent carboxyltransferase family protein [Antricoccus sp.]
MIRILQPGLEATIQDLGRYGYAHLGVPRAGAADRSALLLANRILGNAPGAAAIEFLLGGLALQVDQDAVIAVTGAPVPITVERRAVEINTAIHLQAGQTLTTGSAIYGLRSYLAVAGGIDSLPVLGSRSTDTTSGIGPLPLEQGTLLPVGITRGPLPAAADLAIENATASSGIEVRYFDGPRADFFTSAARREFAGAAWTVTTDINRVGARLRGPALTYHADRQLPSEGMVTGSVQVPGAGQPIVLLCNHGTTGGYPVIAVVHPKDIGKVAQVRPGATVRFRRITF